jgi:hypothetical protein
MSDLFIDRCKEKTLILPGATLLSPGDKPIGEAMPPRTNMYVFGQHVLRHEAFCARTTLLTLEGGIQVFIPVSFDVYLQGLDKSSGALMIGKPNAETLLPEAFDALSKERGLRNASITLQRVALSLFGADENDFLFREAKGSQVTCLFAPEKGCALFNGMKENLRVVMRGGHFSMTASAADFFTQLAAGSDGFETLICAPDYPLTRAPEWMRQRHGRAKVRSCSWD